VKGWVGGGGRGGGGEDGLHTDNVLVRKACQLDSLVVPFVHNTLARWVQGLGLKAEGFGISTELSGLRTQGSWLEVLPSHTLPALAHAAPARWLQGLWEDVRLCARGSGLWALGSGLIA
jgi:hypothetical protein